MTFDSDSRRNLALAVPLILVNAVAIYGQAAWAHDHIAARWPIAIGFAATIESIGVYLAYEAHAALMADQAALKLRVGSYLIGGLAGALNYAHFAPTWRPSPTAVAFALMSAISPWLWGIRSRAMQREQLLALGLIDRRSVRFSMAQWVAYPIKTPIAWRRALFVGEQDPAKARRLGKQPKWLRERDAELVPERAAEPITATLVSEPAVTVDEQPKRVLSPRERVSRWAARKPDLTVDEIVGRIDISRPTARRYLADARAAIEAPPERVNGAHVPDLIPAAAAATD